MPFTPAAESTHAAALEAPAAAVAGEHELATLKPLGQISNSFIVAVGPSGLWLVDQHVAHERILFERHLQARKQGAVESQRLLTPALVELTPRQQALWQEIARELEASGFESEAFGPRTIAVKAAPTGVLASGIDRLLREILESVERETQPVTRAALERQIAAAVACHAAIKVNTPLAQTQMEWLLRELARTELPMTCPHGRPVVLQYSLREIQQAFKRI